MRLLFMLSALIWCFGIGVRLAVIDIRTHRLPNRLVALLGVGLWTMVGVWGLVDRLGVDVGKGPDFVAMGFAVVIAVLLAGWSMAVPMSIGMGDAKLVLALAPAFALTNVANELAALWIVSALAALTVMLRRVLRRVPIGVPLAYGPFLLLSAPVALALGGT
jgi:leader peptidase (prepilin peptidase)/N-methyltransferase